MLSCRVINSGSSGNSYLLTASDGQVLIMECGVKFKEIEQALNFNLRNVVGTLCSHSHADHIRAAKDIVAAGITLHCLKASAEAIGLDNHRVKHIEPNKQFEAGSFKIIGFPLRHDVPCLGFLIQHPDCGKIVFITDTSYVPQRFGKIQNYMIEANYCENILRERSETGTIHEFLHDRVIRSHLSLQSCLGVLAANDLSETNNLLILHLSDSNSDAIRFQKEISEATGKRTTIAKPGVTLNFSKTPF